MARIGKLISRVSSIKRVLRVAFKSWSAIISLSFLFLFVLLISAMVRQRHPYVRLIVFAASALIVDATFVLKNI